MDRNAIRASALGASLKTEIVTIDDIDYEIREPTKGIVAQAQKLMKLNAETKEVGDMVSGEFFLLQSCTYMPGTNEKVFEPADKDTFANSGQNGPMSQLAERISKLMQKAEKDAKN